MKFNTLWLLLVFGCGGERLDPDPFDAGEAGEAGEDGGFDAGDSDSDTDTDSDSDSGSNIPPEWSDCVTPTTCADYCEGIGTTCTDLCVSDYDGNLHGFEACATPACMGAPGETLCVGGCDEEGWEGEEMRCCCEEVVR